jgi:hypothetical protein
LMFPLNSIQSIELFQNIKRRENVVGSFHTLSKNIAHIHLYKIWNFWSLDFAHLKIMSPILSQLDLHIHPTSCNHVSKNNHSMFHHILQYFYMLKNNVQEFTSSIMNLSTPSRSCICHSIVKPIFCSPIRIFTWLKFDIIF